eukprot:TRINITY_DN3855_c0_g1_i1.p1 TRINITY_DN3855_c0_g1~~TRINITY_DN3855_c0_g1_i1.p1  ORF type:complete len:247 (+),score=58.34 TRINITY_DN3855_c0_g1_i1:101-841(+)
MGIAQSWKMEPKKQANKVKLKNNVIRDLMRGFKMELESNKSPDVHDKLTAQGFVDFMKESYAAAEKANGNTVEKVELEKIYSKKAFCNAIERTDEAGVKFKAQYGHAFVNYLKENSRLGKHMSEITKQEIIDKAYAEEAHQSFFEYLAGKIDRKADFIQPTRIMEKLVLLRDQAKKATSLVKQENSLKVASIVEIKSEDLLFEAYTQAFNEGLFAFEKAVCEAFNDMQSTLEDLEKKKLIPSKGDV